MVLGVIHDGGVDFEFRLQLYHNSEDALVLEIITIEVYYFKFRLQFYHNSEVIMIFRSNS